jgi:hypothetical protein
MSLTTETLLARTVYGVPSGNYDGSSQDFYGDPRPAANYFRGRGPLQTVTYDFSGFVGEIVVEATLDADPAEAVWVPVDEIGADSSTQFSGRYSTNLIGNYTWLRVHVLDFSDNIIDSITVTY